MYYYYMNPDVIFKSNYISLKNVSSIHAIANERSQDLFQIKENLKLVVLYCLTWTCTKVVLLHELRYHH